jgi:DNA-binding SARP family transcriptional activator
LTIYQGRYYADSPIREWLTIEEQYYHQQFLLAADRVMNNHLDQGNHAAALEISYKILSEDRYWEPAYRVQMLIFHASGQHSMVHEVYNRCVETLDTDLNAPISSETENLYQHLVQEQ